MTLGPAARLSQETPGRRLLAVVASACLFITTAMAPAFAFELFGRTFFEADDEEVAVVPDAQPYTLDIAVSGGHEELIEAIESASALSREAERPPPGTAGLIARARGDYGRILAALYARGHYGGTIEIAIAGRPAGSLRPDVVLPDPVPVAVTVDPGPLFRFGDIQIDGLPTTTLTRDDSRALDLDSWELVEGTAARSGAILEAEGRMVELWQQRGHPKAEIVTREIVADHRTQTVDVALAVAPGPAAQLATVFVRGTERMDAAFVARQTGIVPGEPYDPDTLEEARERLNRLGVFSSVSLVEDELVGPDGILPIAFNLAERPRRLVGGGVSYSTTEGATLEGFWLHRNLFGRAESVRFDASVSRIGAEGYEDFNYAAATTFRKPGFLRPDTDLTLQLAGEREFVDTYESRTLSARAGLERFFSPELIGRTAVNVEQIHAEDAFGDNEYLLVSLPTELDYDGRDNRLDPTEGLRGTIHLEPFTDLERSTVALVARGSLSGYVSLAEDDRMVLAARGGVGSIVGGSLEDIPATRRFYLGGGGSIRGYEYRTVGPTRGDEVVGGLSFFETSLEVRFRLTERIGLVPFIDAGAAYEDPFPDFGEDIRFGAGVGLRYYTPLGPLRFDVAMPLNPRDGDPGVAFYVGLGQAF